MSAKTVAIPNWNPQGILPPISSGGSVSRDRSPYRASLVDFVLRFGNTTPRKELVEGYLNFRDALFKLSLVNGFQWVDGSFLEDIETVENRDPRDIDVVTFYHLPEGETQEALFAAAPRIFSPQDTKEDYRVDAYYVQLNADTVELMVDQATYWYRLWSHRRNGQWKGYLQIDLSPSEDQEAKVNLDEMRKQGGDP